MASHSARSLFDKNIESAEQSVKLFDGVSALSPKGVDVDWILRAAIVFVVSALDTYFHDKVKYRVGKYTLHNLPPALAKHEICVKDVVAWDKASRKGNVLRNWVTNFLGTKPLQRVDTIADALKLAGIDAVWATIEPNNEARTALFEEIEALVKRRNQIAHEGDRGQSRKSGKKLRKITRKYVVDSIDFAKRLVGRIETAFPK